jgi:hypothetical protein
MVLKTLNQWKVVIGEIKVPIQANLDAPMKLELELEDAWAFARSGLIMRSCCTWRISLA